MSVYKKEMDNSLRNEREKYLAARNRRAREELIASGRGRNNILATQMKMIILHKEQRLAFNRFIMEKQDELQQQYIARHQQIMDDFHHFQEGINYEMKMGLPPNMEDSKGFEMYRKLLRKERKNFEREDEELMSKLKRNSF